MAVVRNNLPIFRLVMRLTIDMRKLFYSLYKCHSGLFNGAEYVFNIYFYIPSKKLEEHIGGSLI